MSTRAAFAVALSAAVLLSVVGPVSGIAPVGPSDGGPIDRTGDGFAQYKVSLNNVTVETWLLRNATVMNATVEEAVVRNVTTANGSRTNVTLSNLTVGRFDVPNATFLNVTAETLVVRNKSVLSVPGGDFIDPNIDNRTVESHTTKNATVSGVVIDEISVDASFLCPNATLGPEATGNTSFEPLTPEDEPDVLVEDGTVGTAVIVQGHATNWSAGSTNQPGMTNVTDLPNGCTYG